MRIWCGVDPGQTGALAAIIKNGKKIFAEVWDYQDIEDGLYVIEYNIKEGANAKCLLEKQQAFPGQGVVSMFKLGENYGKWQGWLDRMAMAYEIITPVQWRKAIFDSMPKQADKKAMSLDMARRLFPKMRSELSRKKDHGRAEALLLAELCRRKNT